MKLYALFITCPLALLVQHLYSEIYITFYNLKTKFVVISIILSGIFSIYMFLGKEISNQVCIEFFLTVIVAILVSVFIGKFEIRKSIECYEKSETIVIFCQMIVGLFWCVVPFLKVYKKYANTVCQGNETVLSKILYISLGLSYIFVNRLFFCKIYDKFFRKNSYFNI